MDAINGIKRRFLTAAVIVVFISWTLGIRDVYAYDLNYSRGSLSSIYDYYNSQATTTAQAQKNARTNIQTQEEYRPSYVWSEPSIDFHSYINDTKHYTITRVLGLGVGRVDPPVQYKDYFDKIIPLSQGNKYTDISKATIDHLKIPITSLQDLRGERINEYWAHSWHADVIINEIRQGNIEVNHLILIDPPAAYRDWIQELRDSHTHVEVYGVERSGFRFIPEISSRDITNEGGHYKEAIPTIGYTFSFGPGESNIHHINTTHSLDNCLDAIFQQKGIDPLHFQTKQRLSESQIYRQSSSVTGLGAIRIHSPTVNYDHHDLYNKTDFSHYQNMINKMDSQKFNNYMDTMDRIESQYLRDLSNLRNMQPKTTIEQEYRQHNRIDFHSLERELIRDNFDSRQFANLRNIESQTTIQNHYNSIDRPFSNLLSPSQLQRDYGFYNRISAYQPIQMPRYEPIQMPRFEPPRIEQPRITIPQMPMTVPTTPFGGGLTGGSGAGGRW